MKIRLFRKKFFYYVCGHLAEFIVIILLTLRFYRIVRRRYVTYSGEIDIIASRNSQILFVEVKMRRKKHPLSDLLSLSQINKIKKSASFFLAKNSKYKDFSVSFELYHIYFFYIVKSYF